MSVNSLNRELALIRSGQKQYGRGTSAEQASRFYYSEILPLVVHALGAKSKSLRDQIGDVDLLVSLLGFSPETVILAATALRPVRLRVLHTANAQDKVAIVQQFMGGQCEMTFTSCDGTSPSSIAAAVQDAAGSLGDNRDKQPALVVDVTGGKKLMSAAAAVAAVRCGCYFCYIEGDYDPELRRPCPGSEDLLVFDAELNPIIPR
jgi:hypothetical protein